MRRSVEGLGEVLREKHLCLALCGGLTAGDLTVVVSNKTDPAESQ